MLEPRSSDLNPGAGEPAALSSAGTVSHWFHLASIPEPNEGEGSAGLTWWPEAALGKEQQYQNSQEPEGCRSCEPRVLPPPEVGLLSLPDHLSKQRWSGESEGRTDSEVQELRGLGHYLLVTIRADMGPPRKLLEEAAQGSNLQPRRRLGVPESWGLPSLSLPPPRKSHCRCKCLPPLSAGALRRPRP